MNSKEYRLREFLSPVDGRSLIVETSAGLSFGPLPGLERFTEAVTPLLDLLDGVITSPGQARKLSGRTRKQAALLVRGDWTNALRGPDFVLPSETINHIPLLSPQDSLDLGASALVLYFLLGHEEAIEAACLHRTVQTALAGNQIGMPLILDIQPIGPRVVLHRKAVELGVSYALEGGADGVAIPWPGEESFKTILTMAAEVPVWIKLSALDDAAERSQALDQGAAGFWLNEDVFAQSEPGRLLENLAAMVHPTTQVEGKGV